MVDSEANKILEPQFLCTRETLASGRDVIFAYDRSGAPIHCWDVKSLPATWTASQCWHQAGVTVLHSAHPTVAFRRQVVLYPLDTMVMSLWLASTYTYLRPILTTFAIPISTRKIFGEYIENKLRDSAFSGVLIDVGGPGYQKSNYIPNEVEVISIDPTHGYNDGLSVIGAQTKRVHRVKGMAESLPFNNAYANCVICQFVLEHLIDPLRALCELARILKVGGLLILGIPIDSRSQGIPAFLHRWRFTWNSGGDKDRTMPLARLDFSSLGLCNIKHDAWKPARQVKDAYLFVFKKEQ